METNPDCPPFFQVYDSISCSCECNHTISRTCLPKFTFDTDVCDCICDSSLGCPASQSLDTSSCECITCDINATTCQSGQTFNNLTCQCECDTQQTCCEGRVFNRDSCSCVCENVQECSAGYVFDPERCQCVCEGSTSEDIWYNRSRECRRDNYKVFNIFSCGCECARFLKCQGNRVVDPNTCRCVCPTSSCVSPKVMNPHTCQCQCGNNQSCRHGYQWDSDKCRCKCQERDCHQGEKFNNSICACERLCPSSNMKCRSGFTFDYNTCRCKCNRTCGDNEVLDSNYCACKEKKVTQPPTRSYPSATTTKPTPRPTTQPPHVGSICPRLRSAFYCYHSSVYYGVHCRYVDGYCIRL